MCILGVPFHGGGFGYRFYVGVLGCFMDRRWKSASGFGGGRRKREISTAFPKPRTFAVRIMAVKPGGLGARA